MNKSQKLKLQIEVMQITNWFKDNDWKVNKIIVGEWSQEDQRWIDYLAERQIKRARQDEINTLLKG